MRGEEIINNFSLFPVYQPIVDIRSGDIIAFEATVKGKNAQGSEIGYEQLREFEKQKDSIDSVGELNLDFRARDLALNEFQLKDHKLFVNVSPEEMGTPLFFEDVNIANVVLEITEESKIHNPDRLKARLDVLRKKGLKVALDDFGSLQQNHDKLDDFKPEFVKLDKSIVKNGKLNFFQPMISIYDIVVEGVETEAHLQNCIELGFHYVQGFYFSRPLTYTQLLTDLYNKDLQQSIKEKLNIQSTV